MTREDISGKIIKLSGRRAGTKKITYEALTRMEMDRKNASKKVEKVLDKSKDMR